MNNFTESTPVRCLDVKKVLCWNNLHYIKLYEIKRLLKVNVLWFLGQKYHQLSHVVSDLFLQQCICLFIFFDLFLLGDLK